MKKPLNEVITLAEDQDLKGQARTFDDTLRDTLGDPISEDADWKEKRTTHQFKVRGQMGQDFVLEVTYMGDRVSQIEINDYDHSAAFNRDRER